MKSSAKKLFECGFDAAMLGISLNKEQNPERMYGVACKLAHINAGSHRKFLRQIQLGWLICLPRRVWTEFDTYKVGVTRNSGSTMHNIHKRPFTEEDFESISPVILAELNVLWQGFKDGTVSLSELKDNLPEGYMQTSVVTMNYEVLRTMYRDRINHKLPEWKFFLLHMIEQIEHSEFIIKYSDTEFIT